MHTPQYGPCNNEDGAYTMIFVGKNGADKVTDEDYREDIEVDKDGKFKVSFDKPGTYVVSGRYYNNDNTRGCLLYTSDYPVHGKAGSVLAAVLLAVLLGMLLFVLVKKKRTGMLLVVWTIWMAGYGIGFFRKRWGLFAGTLFLAIYFACRSGRCV